MIKAIIVVFFLAAFIGYLLERIETYYSEIKDAGINFALHRERAKMQTEQNYAEMAGYRMLQERGNNITTIFHHMPWFFGRLRGRDLSEKKQLNKKEAI